MYQEVEQNKRPNSRRRPSPNRYTFMQTILADEQELKQTKYAVSTAITVMLTPTMFIKLYALYDSLIDTVSDIPRITPNEQLADIMRWVLPISIPFALAVGNQVVINLKYTPFLVKGVTRDVSELLSYFKRCCCRKGYKPLDGQEKVKWKAGKYILDYSTLLAFSILHGAFTFTTLRELLGGGYWTILEVVAGVGLAITLAPMRYCHGLITGKEYHEYEHQKSHEYNSIELHGSGHEDHDHYHDDHHHHGKRRCSLFKGGAGIVLYAVGTSVYMFESLHVIRLISGLPLTHHIPTLFQTISLVPVASAGFILLSGLGGFIETITEVDHIDCKLQETPVIAPKSFSGKFLYRFMAIFGALVSDHIEPFILFLALAVYLEMDAKGIALMSTLGCALTLFDSVTTGPMHAYLFGVIGYLFQDLITHEEENNSEEDSGCCFSCV